ncbi:hypothetical protein IW261DRAFT_1421349 [Armillaria novae-zelandiae]|uniref:Uncharacterized protein n=1 Tax=Armillaria novae-zelandiae TaxID=153914 RepID=A0AA39U840_9AGAR|nr:hypothetical protein IW261DRAFT_1421349 [Armillaria novae-zelandiae]
MAVPLPRTFQYMSSFYALGVPTLAKIKPQHILMHLQMACSEQSVDPPKLVDDSVHFTSMGLTAFQWSLACGKYYAGLESLSHLQEMPPQPSWTSAYVDTWGGDAKGFWEHCKAQFPDEKVASSHLEYNELVNRAHQYSIKVFPLPESEHPVPMPPSCSIPAIPLAPPSLSAISSILQAAAPPKVLSSTPVTGPQPPKLTLLGPHLLVATPEPSFNLDSTSPLHPSAVITRAIATSNTFGDFPSACCPNLLLGAQHSRGFTPVGPPLPPSHPVLPIHGSSPAGIIASSFWKCTPLFFLGKDDEDEIMTLAMTDKGKEKEIISGTDDEEDKFQSEAAPAAFMVVDEDDDASPPPTNTAQRLCSPVVALGSLPITVSELLGAPPTAKPKKCSCKKPKFDGLLPAPPKDLIGEGTVRAQHATKKVAKTKGIEEIPKSGVVATKAIRPQGPSRLHAPPVAMGIQLGGLSEEVPADYMVVRDGVKTIGVLVISRDFGDFMEVDKALWNKKVAPFVGEQYVKPCDQYHCKKTHCHKFLMNLLPCLVNGTKALNPLEHYRPKSYESVNAFKSSLNTLSQHASALEDLIVNYMAGLNAMSHLQDLQSQIGHLRECLGSDTRVEEVVDEDNNEGYKHG